MHIGLGCHGLPVSTGCLAGVGHVDRAHMVCLACNNGAVGDQNYRNFECAALSGLRRPLQQTFTPCIDTMRTCFEQQDHLGDLNYVMDCLEVLKT